MDKRPNGARGSLGLFCLWRPVRCDRTFSSNPVTVERLASEEIVFVSANRHSAVATYGRHRDYAHREAPGMRTTDRQGIYDELGLRRVINAMGSVTVLGGSTLSAEVRAAMDDANRSFVDMDELLQKSGRVIADLLGAEAAFVTSGAFAAMVLGAAGIMTGRDEKRIEQLPDTTGMKNEFLVQAAVRYHYDRAISVPGGRLVEVGDRQRATAEQLRSAIGPRTAAILHPVRSDGTPGVLPVAEVIGIAKAARIPVLVDAAAEIYPLDRMKWIASRSGAEIVCFGAKYIGSAKSTGIICGAKDFVEAASLNNFMAYEKYDNRSLGRGYKVDRQEIAGTVVALREWFTLDHAARLGIQERRAKAIAKVLSGLPHVTTELIPYREGAWWMLRVNFDESRLGTTPAAVELALREGDPSIRVRPEPDYLLVAVHNLKDGEDGIVGERLREVLGGKR